MATATTQTATTATDTTVKPVIIEATKVTATNAIVSKLASFEPISAMMTVDALLTSLDKDGNEKDTLVQGLLSLDTTVGGKEPYVFKVNFSYADKVVNCLEFSINSDGKPSYTVNRNKLFGNKVFTVLFDRGIKTYHQLAFHALANINHAVNQHNDKGYVIFGLLVDKLDIKPEKDFPYHTFTKKVLADCCLEAITNKQIDTDYTRLYLYASAQSKLATKQA